MICSILPYIYIVTYIYILTITLIYLKNPWSDYNELFSNLSLKRENCVKGKATFQSSSFCFRTRKRGKSTNWFLLSSLPQFPLFTFSLDLVFHRWNLLARSFHHTGLKYPRCSVFMFIKRTRQTPSHCLSLISHLKWRGQVHLKKNDW